MSFAARKNGVCRSRTALGLRIIVSIVRVGRGGFNDMFNIVMDVIPEIIGKAYPQTDFGRRSCAYFIWRIAWTGRRRRFAATVKRGKLSEFLGSGSMETLR